MFRKIANNTAGRVPQPCKQWLPNATAIAQAALHERQGFWPQFAFVRHILLRLNSSVGVYPETVALWVPIVKMRLESLAPDEPADQEQAQQDTVDRKRPKGARADVGHEGRHDDPGDQEGDGETDGQRK